MFLPTDTLKNPVSETLCLSPNYVKFNQHSENCNLKDELSQYKSKPDDSSEDNFSVADSLERE
ncbi:hypothetical protein [Phormidium nigroviride]